MNVFESCTASLAFWFCVRLNVSTRLDSFISVITLRAGVCQRPTARIIVILRLGVDTSVQVCVFMILCLRVPTQMHVECIYFA